MAGQFLYRLLHSFWGEQRCLACTLLFRDETAKTLFCPDCATAMPRKERGFCPRCGEPAAWPELPPALCAHCLDEPPLWRDFIFHGPYEGLLRNLLITLKFRNQPFLGHALGTLLGTHPGFAALTADTVIPIPLPSSRLAQRGYNQAQEIARPLARHLQLPLMPDLLNRILPTAPQASASRNERKKNLRNAFAAQEAVRGRHVLLVDDTLTTGATVTAATQALLASGASSVSVAVVGRTSLHG
jgi:ComF family protein